MSIGASKGIESSVVDWSIEEPHKREPSHWAKAPLFLLASYLTDPACYVREKLWRLSLVDHESPDASRITNSARKAFLLCEAGGWAFLALTASVSGMLLRGALARWQDEPYIYSAVPGYQAKTLPEDRTFSLLSWNICCVGGGYSITDGGVSPWRDRIDAVINKIVQVNADVVCLYETFDTTSAYTICNALQQNGYGYVYYNKGPKAAGVCSGDLTASKYEIQRPEFTPFPVDSLDARTKNATKGVFGFNICSENKPFSRVFTTHLQHSEKPQYPTENEINCRKRQMEIICEKVDAVQNLSTVVTGDLNLDDMEFQNSDWKDRFTKNDLYMDSQYTWGGDAFCSGLVGRPVSGPLNLDHTMIVNGTGEIATTLVATGYEANRYKKDALSDHEGLYSTITVM